MGKDILKQPISRRDFLRFSLEMTAFPLLGRGLPPAVFGRWSDERASAAERFGASNWSRKPENWIITPFNLGMTKGFGLNPEPFSRTNRVNVSGCVWETWVKVPDKGEFAQFQDGFHPVVFAISPKVQFADTIGGTGWEGYGVSLEHTFQQLLEREAREQPGVPVKRVKEFPPICVPLEEPPTITSAAQAAAHFGADDYTLNPNNWWIKDYPNDREPVTGHGAFLTPDPEGKTHEIHGLLGYIYTGYIDTPGDGEHLAPDGKGRPIGYVGIGNEPPGEQFRGEMPARGISIYKVTLNKDGSWEDPNKSVVRLFNATEIVERQTQPEILLYQINFNLESPVCPVDPA